METIEIKEIVERQGKALELKEPVKLVVDGDINAIADYLKTRSQTFDHKKAVILFDRSNLQVRFIESQNEFYSTEIKAGLKYNPKFLEFNINTNEYKGHAKLAEFYKMNRSFFLDISEAGILSGQLKNLQAKISKEIEKQNDNKGNVRDLKSQTASTNVMQTFKLNISVFKGLAKSVIEVELYFNPDDMSFACVSPMVTDHIETLKDSIFDEMKKGIQTLYPELTIIEV